MSMSHEHAHESPWVMTVPLILLAFFSVVVAWPMLADMAGERSTGRC